MNAIEKIQALNQLGISKVTLGRYCHCHPTTLDYYLNKGGIAKSEVLTEYEQGLKQLLEDIVKIIDL